MSEAKHTPGPWKSKPLGFATFIYSDQQPNIAAVHSNASPEGQANGRLIRVAPDLLAALRAAETFIADELEARESSFLPDATEEENGYIGSAATALTLIRDAIAKAAGQS